MLRRWAALVLMLGCGVAVWGGDLEDGREALKNNRNVKALKHFDAHIKQAPNDPAGYLARAEAYVALKNDAKATADYTKVITLDANAAEGYLGRARVYESTGQYRQAMSDLNEALFLKTTGELRARCHVLRGHLWDHYAAVDSHNDTDALADYQAAVQHAPGMAWAYSYRGLTTLKMHGLLGTATDSRHPVRPANEAPEAIIKRALADMDKGVELAPKYGRVYALRAAARLGLVRGPNDKERQQQGFDDLAKAIEYAPRKPDAYQVRAEYTLLGLKQQSVLQRADGAVVQVTSFKNDPAKITQALEDLSRAAQYGSRNPMTFHLRAQLYEMRGEGKKALQDYHQACQYDQENGQAWNDVAWRAATHWQPEVRDAKLAVDAATKAIACCPCVNPYWLDTLAAAHAAAGDFPKAIQAQQQALKNLRPSDTHNQAAMRQRLALYEANKPYHHDAPKTK